MELVTLSLKQGIPNRVTLSGSFFKVLVGSGDFTLRTSEGQVSKYVAGLGITLPHFTWIEVVSDNKDQEVRIAISPYTVFDSRLVGEIGTAFKTSKSTIAANSSGELFPVNIDRKSISIAADGDIYLCDYSPADANGFLMTAGEAVFENSGALYAYNDSGSVVTVSKLEESV